jgi:hypothetical protein
MPDVMCGWSRAVADDGTWETGCGRSFNMGDGSPYQNRMRFCCYCGKQLLEVHSLPVVGSAKGD